MSLVKFMRSFKKMIQDFVFTLRVSNVSQPLVLVVLAIMLSIFLEATTGRDFWDKMRTFCKENKDPKNCRYTGEPVSRPMGMRY